MVKQSGEKAPPKTIGDFNLFETLGQGGMGVVYKGQHRVTGQIVALKTIQAVHEMHLESLRREIRTLARIRHPGIVRILAEGIHEGLPWYAMELLSGVTLREHFSMNHSWQRSSGHSPLPTMKVVQDKTKTTLSLVPEYWWTSSLGGLRNSDQRMTTASVSSTEEDIELLEEEFETYRSPVDLGEIGEIISMVRRICGPLAFLHGEGIVHRDLKPENIIIQQNGSPILVDFGLMAWVGGDKSRETLVIERGGAGTINYMAPEQIKGEFVDARTDLYAVGCLLYELLTGRPPFISKNYMHILKGHLYALPHPPSKLRSEILPVLDELVLHLLAKNPRDRLGHADVVATMLARFGRENIPILAGPNPKAYLYRSRFVGRTEVLEDLKDYFDRLQNGHGELVFIGGESGVGKTRLVMEFGFMAAKQRIFVLTGECVDMSGRSLEALQKPLQKLGDHCRHLGKEETDKIIGRRGKVLAKYEPSLSDLPGQDHYPAPAELPVYSARMRLFSYLSETFTALAKKSPLVIILDDLQWADELVLGYFEYIFRTGLLQRAPILIIGTYRSEDVDDELKNTFDASHAVLLPLERLEKHEISTIVSDMLAMPNAPQSLCSYLLKHSEGNPFFVIEYLRAAVEEGFLWRDDQGNWKVDSKSEIELTPDEKYGSIPLPLSLQGLIERRLMSLPVLSQKVVSAAAVGGLEVSILLLWDITEMDDEEILDVIEELLKRQILMKSGSGKVRFFHAKIREVAISRIEGGEQQKLHRMAADGIERLFPSQRDLFLSDLAHHREKAVQLSQARSCYYAAAKRAKEQYDYGNAERFYHNYFRLSPGPSKELVLIRNEFGSEVLSVQGKHEEAMKHHELALKDTRGLGLSNLGAECLSYMGTILSTMGKGEEAHTLYEKALQIAQKEGDRKLEGRALGDLARLHYDQGRLDSALELFKQAIILAREVNDRKIEGRTLLYVARLHQDRGLLDEAQGLFEQALAITCDEGDRINEGSVLNHLAILFQGKGELARTGELYNQALDIACEVGDRKLEGMIMGNLANLSKNLSRLDEAESYYNRSLRIAREVRDRQSESRTLGNLAGFYQDHGRFAKAQKMHEQALSIAREIGFRKGEGINLLNLGLLNHDVGHLDKARQSYDLSLKIQREVGDRRVEGFTLNLLAELECELGNLNRAQELYDQALSIATDLNDQSGQGMILSNLGRFHLERGNPDKARQIFDQALKITRQISDKLNEGIILTRLANWTRRITGDLGAAEKSVLEAHEIQHKLQNTKDLALIDCELGHITLARQESAQNLIMNANKRAQQLAVEPMSEIGSALSRLRHAQKVFESGESDLMFRGEAFQDIPEELQQYLEENGVRHKNR